MCAPSFAQAAGPSKPPQEQKKDEPKKDEPKKDPKTVEYEAAIKDLKRVDGSMPIYVRKKEILLELPESQLGKIFLIQLALATGGNPMGMQAGDPIGPHEVDAFRWEKNDEKVWLVRPNFRYRWNKDDPFAIASDRSFPEAILGSFPIEQTDPEKKLMLVNITPLFTGDLFRLGDMVNLLMGGQYMLDRDKSSILKARGYADNTIVQEKMHFMSPRGSEGSMLMELLGIGGNQLEDGRSFPLEVTFNMWYRKDDGYVPRLADPRVGYFTDEYFSVDRFLNDDRTQRYIIRWNLKKKDPKAALSEPVKPIVWTLDPSIPKEYRAAVKEGVLHWNKAYEALGYKNAVQVQDVPESDKDYDHADGRYNVIRWTMSEKAAYAISQFRTDPFTGEILNASITVDANMLQYVLSEHQSYATPSATARQYATQALLRDPQRLMPADAYIYDHDHVMAEQQLDKSLKELGWSNSECHLSEGLASDAAFQWGVLQSVPGMRISKEEYAKKFISDVVCHELGHCLGLRHNFVASTNLTTAQLADDALTSEIGTSASVMDYNPVNVQAVLKGHGNFYMTTVGPYDLWAIKYGYTDLKGSEPADEKYELSRIASQSGVAGHAFMTDELANSWDPYVVRFDAAKDPVTYSERNIEAAKRAEKYAIEQLPRPGEGYAKRTGMILSSVVRVFREGRSAARFVGGLHSIRQYKGDTNERPTLAPVDASVQRQAMSLVVRNCFAADAFDLPSSVLTNLSQDPSDDQSASWTAPVRDIVSMQQQMLFATLMSADTTDRIVENAYKLGGNNAYTVDEHFSKLLGAVFSEIGADKSVSPMRRDLQRFAVNALTVQAGAGQNQVSDDVRMLASDSLRRLSARYGLQLKRAAKVDAMTRLYLRDTKETIDRFLARQISTPR